jgi:ribosomal protein S18 acetylase RimI-like enzyme
MLIVHREVQRQGLGTEIFQHLVAYVQRELKWSTLRAGVNVHNAQGLAFLKGLGFQVLEERRARFPGGIQPWLLLEMALAPELLQKNEGRSRIRP